jgi:hypothetical protein
LLAFVAPHTVVASDEGYDLPDLAAVQWEAVLSLMIRAEPLLQSRANGYLI